MPALHWTSDFLIGAAIGSGNTALAAERGGADLLLAINAGRLRNMGAPSIACMLPIADATQMTESFAGEELLAQCRIPVFLGVNVWGPTFEPVKIARRVKASGFAGAVNFPSCMHYPRPLQQILSHAGRGIEQEVELLRAVQDQGLAALFYCATRTQARLAADAGIQLICLNLGWNVGGALGHQMRTSIEEVAAMAREISRLVKRISPSTRFLLEGGPIAKPEDLGRVLSLAQIDGYVGGSTIERIPLEVSIADQIDGFRQSSRRQSGPDQKSTRLLSWAQGFGFCGRSQSQLAFLHRLRDMTPGGHPVILVTEKGLDVQPTLRALSRAKGPQIVRYNAASENVPARTRSFLFGHRNSPTDRAPALADSTIHLLAIEAPEGLSPALQQRLAEALKSGSFRAPGTKRTIFLGPRIVLITNMATLLSSQTADDLTAIGLDPALAEVMAGWVLRLPPVRERIDDLMQLITHASEQDLGRSLARAAFSAAATSLLQSHRWPGNDQELTSLVGHLCGHGAGHPLQIEDIRPLLDSETVASTADRSEKDWILEALWRHGFNRSKTAAALGISRKTLYNKIRKYNLSG